MPTLPKSTGIGIQ